MQLHNLCSAEDTAWAEAQYPQFDALLAAGDYMGAAAIDNSILGRLTTDANISDPYNILDNPDPTAARVAALQTYLGSSAVQQALNVVPAQSGFTFCGSAAYSALGSDEERYAGYQLRWAINNGLSVTIYNGDLDLVCLLFSAYFFFRKCFVRFATGLARATTPWLSGFTDRTCSTRRPTPTGPPPASCQAALCRRPPTSLS